MRRNEQMLQESRNAITIPSSFLLRILTYLNRRGKGEYNTLLASFFMSSLHDASTRERSGYMYLRLLQVIDLC